MKRRRMPYVAKIKRDDPFRSADRRVRSKPWCKRIAAVGARMHPLAMSTPVTGRCNLHAAATYGQPLGVRCLTCEHRALVPLDKIGAVAARR